MNNTVKLTGKGWAAMILFIRLAEEYENSHLSQGKKKWWQSEVRYELRLQNLSIAEIEDLRYGINLYWPLATWIKMEVF